jgi:putative chitinase
MTRIDKAIAYGKALLDPPTDYGYWGGEFPFRPGPPMWANVKTGAPPNPKNGVPNTSCTGLINLMNAAGGSDYRGGTLAYGQDIKNKRAYKPGMHLRRGEVLVAAFGAGDEGHIVMCLEDGNDPLTIGSDHTDGGANPGVNVRYRAQRAHDLFGFEWVGEVPGLELPPSGGARVKPRPHPRPEPRRQQARRPEEPRPERPEPRVTLFTAKQLSEIAENPDLATLERYRNALVPEMQKAGITTHARIAAFLANVVQETDRLQTLEEYGGYDYWLYLDRNSGRPGEWRYHGRGFLMNTWKDAYARLSEVLGEDLVSEPDLLARPDLAAKAATWFWAQNGLNAYADRGEFKQVCAIINTGSPQGAPNHLTERMYFYDRAKRAISRTAGDAGTTDDGHDQDGPPRVNLAAVGQADETAAFALAEEICKVGVGVTVTNGADNVYALAKTMRDEPLGHRQLWIMGQPALEACGEYGDLANWPASPSTDYYDLAGKGLTGTCSRAAQLADEKVAKGVGRRFLEEMGMSKSARPKPPLLARTSPGGEDKERERRTRRKEENRRHHVEPAEPAKVTHRDLFEGATAAAQGEHDDAALGVLVDGLRNNKALMTWFAGAAVTWLAGHGLLGEGDTDQMTTNFVTGLLFVLGLLSRQLTYGPVTVRMDYRKKDAAESDAKPRSDVRRSPKKVLA